MKPQFSYSECYDIVVEEKAISIDSVDVDVETTDATGEVFFGVVKIHVAGESSPRCIDGQHHVNDWMDDFGIVLNFGK